MASHSELRLQVIGSRHRVHSTIKYLFSVEREEWIRALNRFIPTTKHIDLTLRRILINVEYLMENMRDIIYGGRLGSEGTPRKICSRMMRIGLIGTLREFFAEQWDPAFAAAWRFFDKLMRAVHDRTRLTYQKKSLRGSELFPHEDQKDDRRYSFVNLLPFRSLFMSRKGAFKPRQASS